MTGLGHPAIHGSDRFECGVARRGSQTLSFSLRWFSTGRGVWAEAEASALHRSWEWVNPPLNIEPRYALRRRVGEKSSLADVPDFQRDATFLCPVGAVPHSRGAAGVHPLFVMPVPVPLAALEDVHLFPEFVDERLGARTAGVHLEEAGAQNLPGSPMPAGFTTVLDMRASFCEGLGSVKGQRKQNHLYHKSGRGLHAGDSSRGRPVRQIQESLNF